MFLYLERFVIPTLVALAVLLISNQAKWQFGKASKAIMFIGVLLLGFIVAEVVETNQRQPNSRTLAFVESQPIGNKPDYTPAPPTPPSPVQPVTSGANPPTEILNDVSPEDTFIQKYVMQTPKKQGTPCSTVVIIDPDAAAHSRFAALSSAATDALLGKGYVITGLFRPSLIEDRAYEDLFAPNPALLQRLASYCDAIVLAQAHTVAQDIPLPENVLTVRMSLDVKIVGTQPARVRNQFSISENGSGFTQEQAREQAEARLAASFRKRLEIAIP